MPKIGMRYPIIAKKGSSGYTDAFICGKAVQGSATPTTYNVKFFADDVLAENSTGITDWQISLDVSDLPAVAANVLFGHTVSEGEITRKSDDQTNYVGVGFYVPKMQDGAITYDAYWYYKVKFTEPTQSFTTRGETITFNGDSISGTASEDDSKRFNTSETFATPEEAENWLNTQANYAVSA